MEIAGRAGGLIATNRIALRTLVLRGDRDVSALGGAEFERDPNIGENLLALFDVQPNDIFIIASNSGVNGSILGVALAAKARGHKVIAVTSLDHTMKVHAQASERQAPQRSRRRHHRQPGALWRQHHGARGRHRCRCRLLDHRGLYCAAHHHRRRRNDPPARQDAPVYISANIPGGDEHNRALEDLYGERIRREA